MNIGISLIICIVGGLLYVICNRYGPPEVAELGRNAFWVGLSVPTGGKSMSDSFWTNLPAIVTAIAAAIVSVLAFIRAGKADTKAVAANVTAAIATEASKRAETTSINANVRSLANEAVVKKLERLA